MKLFKLEMKNSYKSYYVLADDYNSAVLKCQKHKKSEVKSLIGSDGSLQIPSEDDDVVSEIRLLTEDVIR